MKPNYGISFFPITSHNKFDISIICTTKNKSKNYKIIEFFIYNIITKIYSIYIFDIQLGLCKITIFFINSNLSKKFQHSLHKLIIFNSIKHYTKQFLK